MNAVVTPPPEREPCGVCGEPVALAATTCVHCGASALVEVRLIPAIRDGRVRYQVARAISALGPPARPFPVLQTALAETAAGLATGATRLFARRIDEALAPFELQADLTPLASGGLAAGGRKMAVAAAVVLVVVFGLFSLWRRRGGTPASTPSESAQVSPEVRPGGASNASTDTAESRPADVLASTVAIRCTQSLGSGFFVAEDLVLTNAHVLCPPADTMRLTLYDGRTAVGDAIQSDTRLDLALIRVVGLRGRPIAVGDAGTLSAGSYVALVGSPMGMTFTYHQGLVSNPSRPLLGVSYIQIDARVNPGNSGGPLVDAHGRVVGIVSLKRTDAEGIALALPINYAYAPEVAMIPAPSAAAASGGFGGMQAKASEAEAGDIRELSQIELRPLLVGARDDAYGRLVARIVLPARAQPAPQNFSFHFRNGGHTICPLGGMVTDWRVVEASELSRSLGGRYGDFVQRNGLDARLYAGEAAIPVGNCSGVGIYGSDLTLEMEGADDRASQVRIR